MQTSIIEIKKKIVLGLILLFTGTGIALSQDTISEQPATKPLVKAPFESSYFISDQTVKLPPAKTLEFVLQHDFGTIQNQWKDFYGIWAAANIRLGLNFTVSKNVQIGAGTTKNKRIQDFSLKYTFLRQKKGGFPFTIGVFGDWGINASEKANFGKDYKFIHRFSYFAEIMIAKRFCKEFSCQLGVAWVHYNIVDTTMRDSHVNGMHNDNLNISGIGRIRLSPQSSVILTYSQPVLTYLNTPPWPNFGLGVEIATSSHVFQIFLTAAQGIVPQEVVMYNSNNPYNGYILLGFNITRLWSF
jgi:hypothetical protein